MKFRPSFLGWGRERFAVIGNPVCRSSSLDSASSIWAEEVISCCANNADDADNGCKRYSSGTIVRENVMAAMCTQARANQIDLYAIVDATGAVNDKVTACFGDKVVAIPPRCLKHDNGLGACSAAITVRPAIRKDSRAGSGLAFRRL